MTSPTMGGGSDDVSTKSDAGGDGVNINVKTPNGSKYAASISLNATVLALKEALSLKCEIPVDQQRLIYKGRILKDDQTLRSYGLEADHAVHLVRSFAPSVAANTAGATNAGSENSTPRGAGPNGGGALGVSGNGGTGDLFGSGFPGLEQVQQQFTRDMMNAPLFDNLVNSTDMIQNMVMNNPQMREIIDRNPELGHVLNDPSTIRQTLEAARNPELMREMMRNSDRVMSNIEASPEGFNMLRRMYENVQEPLLNASNMAGNAGFDSSNPLAAFFIPQSGNPTRTQSNSSAASSDSATSPPAPNSVPLPNPWSPTGWDGRPQTQVGHTGVGFPEFEVMMDSMQDNTLLNQAVQNPVVSQLMQNFISNPQNFSEGLESNPQLQSMLTSNAFFREMIENPEFFRQLASPETMQLFFILLQGLLSLLGEQEQQSSQEPGEMGQTGGSPGSVDNTGLEALLNMFGGLGTGSPDVPNRQNVPPEELYAAQLSQLQEMGFFDRQENIRALMTTAGNVRAAVDRLLGNSGR
ncbi:ubiquitin domain-containing protein DSK2a-like [Argentina anserina]|uniref:ubiquitin domain-containing protein DSK2a-like n=1 Tax=Argentina anserina TaxID=57926 RepID=UPI0021764D25|nr:ubiquitin domain-containing protein DSK2a-like [Potentilla anserina]